MQTELVINSQIDSYLCVIHLKNLKYKYVPTIQVFTVHNINPKTEKFKCITVKQLPRLLNNINSKL